MEERDYGPGIKGYAMTADEALKFLDNLKDQAKARDFVNEGAQLFLAGDSDGAEAKWKEAIAANPNNAVAHGNIASIYFRRQQYQAAIPWLERALALDPNLAGATDCLRDCRARLAVQPSAPSPSGPPVAPVAQSTGHKKAWWRPWK